MSVHELQTPPVPTAAQEREINAFAGLLQTVGQDDFYGRLLDFFRQRLGFDSASIYEFAKGLQPRPLHQEGGGFDADSKLYLDGLYLLDPYYDLYENEDRTGVIHLSAKDGDGFLDSEFFKTYWRRMNYSDEVGALYPLNAGMGVHLAFLFREDDAERMDRYVSLMGALNNLLQAVFSLHHRLCHGNGVPDEISRRQLHQAVSRTLAGFGADALTAREQKICQLLLKGHSAKGIARLLAIAPGTVGIHRANIYRKLEVSSQGELFSLYLRSLSGS